MEKKRKKKKFRKILKCSLFVNFSSDLSEIVRRQRKNDTYARIKKMKDKEKLEKKKQQFLDNKNFLYAKKV